MAMTKVKQKAKTKTEPKTKTKNMASAKKDQDLNRVQNTLSKFFSSIQDEPEKGCKQSIFLIILRKIASE